jgi:hypothetical protein
MPITFSFRVISEWQRRHTKWQAAAQVFWLDIEANAKEISKKLLSSEKLLDLLDLWVLPNIDKSPKEEEVEFRNLENVIRKVNPRGVKKGRPPSKNALIIQQPVFIPFVYDIASKEVNLDGLHIALDVMVKVMKIQKKSLQDIVNHPLIYQYKSLTLSDPFFKRVFDAWVVSAFQD